VTAAFAAVARKLRGFLYAAAVGDDTADVITYRGTFSQRELMLIWPEFTDFTGSAVARAMGTRAYLDATEGWHKSLSNTGVMGVTGLTKDVFFDILSTDTMAGVLNDGGLTTLIRQTGFRFWGNRTCSDDPKFAFECVVRSSNFLKDTIAQGLLWAIDKPLTAQLIKDIVESINAELRKLVRQGRLIGASCWFDPAANSATDLAGGKLVLDYDFTAVAPNEAMGLNQRITDKYYANIAQQLQALG
jgi:phage tail sheath protein FI